MVWTPLFPNGIAICNGQLCHDYHTRFGAFIKASFASHLLQANYDFQTIQELLEHSGLRTTMIYSYKVQSRTIKQA